MEIITSLSTVSHNSIHSLLLNILTFNLIAKIILSNKLNKLKPSFVRWKSPRIPNNNKQMFASGDCNICSSLITQETNWSSVIWSNCRNNNNIFFLPLERIDRIDHNSRITKKIIDLFLLCLIGCDDANAAILHEKVFSNNITYNLSFSWIWIRIVLKTLFLVFNSHKNNTAIHKTLQSLRHNNTIIFSVLDIGPIEQFSIIELFAGEFTDERIHSILDVQEIWGHAWKY